MFREVITVKWRGDTYTASKINLSKEISNVSNSYHIRIQAYQLDQKIDEKCVFILQLKHTRNVRNVVSNTTPTIGISMHNQYRMDMGNANTHSHGHSDMNASSDNRRRHVAIRSSERKRSSSSFFDQIWLQHKSQPFLKATVNTIFRAFDCDDFIQYNQHTNQFEFKFEAKQNMTTLTKYVSLSRKQYSKEEAETLLKDRHHAFETIKPCKVQVGCVNSHEIEDKDWDFEVNLTLLPGKYEFYIDELFGKVPTQIHARDYPRIREFYQKKLKTFVRSLGIFEQYLNHLSTFEPRYKMMEWSKNGVESGPLFGLYSILCDIAATDNIWHDLFEICLKDKIDDKIIRNSISEQTVADFIALSLKYYVKDVVKRRIKLRELKKQNTQAQTDTPHKKKSTKNKEGLDKYILSESDRYILSIILPYFGSPNLKSIHKSVGNESLTSGLFNHFCQALKYDKKAAETDGEQAYIDDTWCMKVPPLELKNKLLKHLHVEKYDVVKQYYVAVLQHVPAVEKGDKTRWTFYIRPSTYSEIFNGRHKINMNAYTFMDYFEFKQRNVAGLQYLNLIIKCIDVSFECDWAMWTKKKLKLYPASLGYWKLLSTFDDVPRVPVDHLDCMLALLRHDAMQISNKLLRNEDQYLSVVFLKEKINNAIVSGGCGELVDNKWMEEEVEAEYQLTFWNGKATGNSSLSLKLVKAAHAQIDKKKNLKSRDSHFIHYRSKDEDIEWLWYDNDAARYKEYELGSNVPKQLEATYQGVSEEIFPLDQFKRETKSDTKERTFNCAQLPNMSKALVDNLNFGWKPFVLRFTFHKHGGKIINIEQLAINSYYDQFPRNVKRVYSGKSGVMINDEEQRVSSLGEMNIYQSKKTIVICWKFPQNAELGITLTYHYKVQIPMLHEIKFKRLLDCWRTNTLFDQTMSNRSMKIVQSRMWKTDTKMPPIKDITRYDTTSHNDPDYGDYGGMKPRDISEEDYSDEDEDKDEEKQSKLSSKKEECIPCQMISTNHNHTRKKHTHESDSDDGIPAPDKVRRDRSQSTTQLAQIDKYQHLKTQISDMQWDLLDKLDDKQRCTSNLIKQKPVYASLPEAQSVWSLWLRRHAPHKFRKELYKLVSLTFIQSIISVMKNHLHNNKENKALIIVISDEREMYQEIFGLNNSEDYISANSKSLSYLFDGIGEVKRIDSKGNIYSIHISQLQKEIIEKGYYHELISMTSAKFKETLVLFTRPNDEGHNLYISHNGYISKISLRLHDEDLHYFLPLFIPLKVGDCVNIEAFSSPDNGTIVALWRNPERNNIVYRIRSTENVYYIMNYYKLVNRAQPKEYWYKNGIKTNIIKYSDVWDDVKLWKTEKPNGDPSDPSHPLHGVILALVESSKQAIASIEFKLKVMAAQDKANELELKKLAIQHKLQNTGAIFLFYRSVEILDKGEDVLVFEREELERKENERTLLEEVDEVETFKYGSRVYEDSDGVSEDDMESVKASNERGLSHLIKFLKRNKLICNVEKYKYPKSTSYDDFCEKAKGILKGNCNNKVYLCHMTERKRYALEEVDGGHQEEAIDIDNLGNGTDYDDGSGGEDDEWLTFEPEEDDKPQLKKEEAEKRVILKSTFECEMVYEFEMCSVHTNVLTIEDIMIMQNEKRNWTTEDHKLLTQFHNNNIWNKFDLLDKQLINRLKARLFQNHTNVGDTNKLKLLEKKFIKFTEAVPKTLKENNINNPLTQYVIAGVEVTRNAKLLQEYIEKFRRYKKSDDEQMLDYDGDAEIIESNNDRTMIVAYNPIQTVVVTSTMIKDVTHPIHLYRAAYDEKFYPKDQITQLNAEWMQTQTKNANIINALSTLLRYNKKYEIILVPSSIHLDTENFLKSRCEMVAPEHESIADYRITFLYKGLLYRYDKKKAKKFKQQSLSIIKAASIAHHLDDLDDDDEKIFVDEIKFLLRLLHDNISEEQPDAMDPDEAVFDKSPHTQKESLSTTLPMIISSLTSQPSFNNYPSFSATPMDISMKPHRQKTSTRRRLRGSIKRKHTDRIFRWLNVGCGSCFLHESSGRAKEIGPKKGADYDKEFPKQLQRAMFLYYIDCRVPFNEDIISQESQCAICKQLMIDPADIGNPHCIHIFCKLCIQQWYFVNFSSMNNALDNPMGGNPHGAQRSSCPICRRPIREITVQPKVIPNMKKGIPTTIYQQIMEENQSRFLRRYLVDTYLAERERVLQAENSDQNLGAAIENDPRLGHRLAGYR